VEDDGARWIVYTGDSLKGCAEPLTVELDDAAIDLLNQGDRGAWVVFLMALQHANGDIEA
jgi:hypothetical protein